MDLDRVDMNLLVAFDALMTEGGVTAAANRLHVGQSSMSATLLRLRRLLDDPVLVRTGRKMVPTPLAESLRGPIHEALSQIDQLLTKRPVFDPTQDHRTFSILASEYATVAVLQPLSVRLRTIAPNVRLLIRPIWTTFMDDFIRNDFDFMIVPTKAIPPGATLSSELLYLDPFVVAVDKSNPKVIDRVDMELFSTLPYIAVRTPRSRIQTVIETELDALGIVRRTAVTTDFALAPFLLRDTLLMTLIPATFASFLAEGVGLKLFEPPMALQPLEESLFWNPRLQDEPAHRWLRSELLDVTAPLRQQAATT